MTLRRIVVVLAVLAALGLVLIQAAGGAHDTLDLGDYSDALQRL